jgi:uncharacterized RDD family membrane protein YckC
MERIDTAHTVETPEGVDFFIHPAGPIPRIQAAAIDVVLRFSAFGVVAMILGLLGKVGAGIILVVFFAFQWGYPIFFEMYFKGVTPGKRMYNLQVRSADGTPISWRGSILRNLLRVADFFPVAYVGGIATMAMTKRFQRMGDLAADTVVCYRRQDKMPTVAELPDVRPASTTRTLSVDEQAAIVRFAARSRHWNAERNEELAEILEELTGTSDPEEGVRELQGLANSILHGS